MAEPISGEQYIKNQGLARLSSAPSLSALGNIKPQSVGGLVGAFDSGKTAAPAIKAPASATSIGGLSVQESPFKPQWDFAGYNNGMYTFKYNSPNVGSSSTMYGYNPSMKKWYSNYMPAPTGPNVQSTGWKALDVNKYKFDNTGMLQTLADPTLGGYSLKNGSLYRTWKFDEQGPTTKLLYKWTKQTDPDDPDDPDTPYDDTNLDSLIEYIKHLQEQSNKQMTDLQSKYDAQINSLKSQYEQNLKSTRETEQQLAAEKAARIASRRDALEKSGLWNIVKEAYADSGDDLNSYLDTGAFSRNDYLTQLAQNSLTGLNEDLGKQYGDAMSMLQRQFANSGFGDTSWMKALEGALRQQKNNLTDVYGKAYDPNSLATLLSSSPEYISGTSWSAPKSVSDLGGGLYGFAALNPTLAKLIPGGIDEAPQDWYTDRSGVEKQDPWKSLYGIDDSSNRLSAFIKALFSNGSNV